MPSSTAPAPDDPEGVNQIRFWVDGLGWIGAVPASPWADLRWTLPPGFDVTGRTFRAQLLGGEAPSSDMTPPAPLDACVLPCFSGFFE